MARRRGRMRIEELANGPAKLTQAMGIDGRMNGEDLVRSRRLFIERGRGPEAIATSSRVGVRRGRELQWRFFVRGSRFVSKARPVVRAQNP